MPKPKAPKQVPSAVARAVAAGRDQAEVQAAVERGWFKKGPDPRRGDPRLAAAHSPKPGVARAAARMAWFERIPWLAEVVDGEPQAMQRVYKDKNTGKETTVEFKETPQVKDRIAAMHELGEMAGVKTMAFTDGEGGDPVPTTVWNLPALTVAQLEALHVLASHARPRITAQASIDSP